MADKRPKFGSNALDQADRILWKEISPGTYALVQGAVLMIGENVLSITNRLPTDATLQIADVDVGPANRVPSDSNLQIGDIDVGPANRVPCDANLQIGDIDVGLANRVPSDSNLQIGDADVGVNNPVPVEEIVRPADDWTYLMTGQVFDDDPTSAYSDEHDISNESALWVHISVESANAPTNIRILAQFEDDVNWADFEEGFFGSLFWEDTETADGVHKAHLLPCGGEDNLRFYVVATGTDGANTFTVTIKVRAFHGNFGVAHA